MTDLRVGQGYDVHRLVSGRKLVLGGVTIPYEKGLHAVCDALLGAAALGDIGKHFPDTDGDYKGIDSRILLKRVIDIIENNGYRVVNTDCTVIAQRPKLSPYTEQMRENIANDCRIAISAVNVKATTEEGLGFTGAGEGIAAHAVCLIEKIHTS